MSMSSRDFARGSLDAVHEALISLGLGPDEIERSLGWARGHYEQLFDEPGRVSLDDYSALVHLTRVQPLPPTPISGPPERLPPESFGKRRLLRQATPIPPDGIAGANEPKSLEIWASYIVDLLILLIRIKRLESRSIARIIRDSLRSLLGSDDTSIQ